MSGNHIYIGHLGQRLCASVAISILFACSTCSTPKAFAAGQPNRPSQQFEMGVNDASKWKSAKVLDAPKPEISSELAGDKLMVSCLARFQIAADGKTHVALLTSSGSDELDETVLSTLKKWKFQPATLNGKPTISTRRLLVEFEVK